MFGRSNVFAVIILFLTIHSLSYAFSDLARVYDPENSTFRKHCKLKIYFPTEYADGSGCLIDSKHVITAAHCVKPKGLFVIGGDEIADYVKVFPAYDNGKQPYGSARSIDYFWLEEWDNSIFSHDIAVIELDRPIGALTGWCDYYFNDNPDFYTLNDFYNPSYPKGDIFDGESMYVWGGSFEEVGDPLWIYKTSYGGQSGSAAYLSGTNTIYAILSGVFGPLRTSFARITSDKYSDIQHFIASNTPSSPDLIPLDVRVYGGKKKVGDFHPTIGPGGSFDSFDFLVHNYSSSSWDGTVTAKVYVSNDEVIEPSDSLIETCLYLDPIGPKESIRVSSQSSLNCNRHYFI